MWFEQREPCTRRRGAERGGVTGQGAAGVGAVGPAEQGPGPPQPLPFGFGVFPPARLTGRVPGLNRRAGLPRFSLEQFGPEDRGRARPRSPRRATCLQHTSARPPPVDGTDNTAQERPPRVRDDPESRVSGTGLRGVTHGTPGGRRAGSALVTLPSQVACPQGPHHRTAHARPPGRPCLGLTVCPQKGVIRVHADQVPGSHWGEGVLQGHRGPRRTERARTTVAPLRPAHLLHGVCTYACTVRVCVYVHLLCTANPGQSVFTKRAGVRGFSSLW